MGTVERLNLALLIHAQDHRALGRRHVEPDDVAHLLNKLRIGGELESLESLGAVRLQTKGSPDTMDRRRRVADRLGHAPRETSATSVSTRLLQDCRKLLASTEK